MILAHVNEVHTSLVGTIRRLFASAGWIATGEARRPSKGDYSFDFVRSTLMILRVDRSNGFTRGGSALPERPYGAAHDRVGADG
jgi:hypothetical protein